jgi:hypothetical protein
MWSAVTWRRGVVRSSSCRAPRVVPTRRPARAWMTCPHSPHTPTQEAHTKHTDESAHRAVGRENAHSWLHGTCMLLEIAQYLKSGPCKAGICLLCWYVGVSCYLLGVLCVYRWRRVSSFMIVVVCGVSVCLYDGSFVCVPVYGICLIYVC